MMRMPAIGHRGVATDRRHRAARDSPFDCAIASHGQSAIKTSSGSPASPESFGLALLRAGDSLKNGATAAAGRFCLECEPALLHQGPIGIDRPLPSTW